jgi:hypothetical protein
VNARIAALPHPQLLRLDAHHLSGLARDLKDSHTINGKWSGGDPVDAHAKDEHDELRAIAKRLRQIAKR